MSTMVVQTTYLGLETCSSAEPVEEVAANMQAKNIRLLLVLDQKGQPIGTLASNDIALSMMGKKQDSNRSSQNDAHGEEFKSSPHVRIRSRNLKPEREYAAG
jgi:predicted transcriptional regulator